MTAAYKVFRVHGIPEALKKLKMRKNRLGNWQEAFQRIADDFISVQKGWLDSRGRGEWKPLRPRYAAWKRRRYPGKPIMKLTGALYDDLTGRSGNVTVRRDSMSIRAIRSGRRWRDHNEGTAHGNPSGYARTVRRVISPAIRLRRTTWRKIMTDWASGK